MAVVSLLLCLPAMALAIPPEVQYEADPFSPSSYVLMHLANLASGLGLPPTSQPLHLSVDVLTPTGARGCFLTTSPSVSGTVRVSLPCDTCAVGPLTVTVKYIDGGREVTNNFTLEDINGERGLLCGKVTGVQQFSCCFLYVTFPH